MRAWLFDHCDSYQEYQFFDDLYDDLGDMCDLIDSVELESWYASINPDARIDAIMRGPGDE